MLRWSSSINGGSRMWRSGIGTAKSLKIVIPVAVVVALGGTGIAVAATLTATPASQFTVVKGAIRTATGTPRPASGTEAVLWGNSSYATTTIDGSGRVLVGAVGDDCDGWPTISVSVDGTRVGGTTIAMQLPLGSRGGSS